MNNRPLLSAGILLGAGLGGFFDGILLHQALQLHSMLSAKLPQDELVNVKISMVWDGLFHAFTWLSTCAGLAVLWHSGKRGDRVWSGVSLWGALLIGWGTFNFVEGLIDHFILEVHHVVERHGLSVYDYIFLASGIAFVVAGMLLIKNDRYHLSSPDKR